MCIRDRLWHGDFIVNVNPHESQDTGQAWYYLYVVRLSSTPAKNHAESDTPIGWDFVFFSGLTDYSWCKSNINNTYTAKKYNVAMVTNVPLATGIFLPYQP